MNALAEKTDVLKMTLQQLMELVEVELLDVKRILFSRYLPVREFIGSRYDQQAGRLKQAESLHYKRHKPTQDRFFR